MTFEDIAKNYSSYSLDSITSFLSEIMHKVNYTRYLFKNQHLDTFYRARKHNHKDGALKNNQIQLFKNDIEFWNPPEKDIFDYGRCNDKNESLFYCSNNFKTCIAEVKPKKDEFITVCSFLPINKCNFFINPIGINKLQELNATPTINQIPKPQGGVLDLDKQLEKLFLLDIKDDEKEKYKLSIAVSKCLLKDITNQFGEIRNMDGIMYPSLVSNIYKSVNFALIPISVIENFKVSSIQTFRVLEKNKDKITIKLVKNALTHGQKFNCLFWQEIPEKYGEEFTFYCFPT